MGKMTLAEWLTGRALTIGDLSAWRVTYDNMFKRIVAPVYTMGGKYSMDIVRNLETEPKYELKPLGCRPSCLLYGLDRARGAIDYHGYVVVVEGFSDVIALHKALVEMTVASITSNLSLVQRTILVTLTDTLIVWADGDDAGREFAKKVTQAPGKVIAFSVAGHDPASFCAQRDHHNPLALVNDVLEYIGQLSYIEFNIDGTIAQAIEVPDLTMDSQETIVDKEWIRSSKSPTRR